VLLLQFHLSRQLQAQLLLLQLLLFPALRLQLLQQQLQRHLQAQQVRVSRRQRPQLLLVQHQPRLQLPHPLLQINRR
jgi:hypothetical protein